MSTQPNNLPSGTNIVLICFTASGAVFPIMPPPSQISVLLCTILADHIVDHTPEWRRISQKLCRVSAMCTSSTLQRHLLCTFSPARDLESCSCQTPTSHVDCLLFVQLFHVHLFHVLCGGHAGKGQQGSWWVSRQEGKQREEPCRQPPDKTEHRCTSGWGKCPQEGQQGRQQPWQQG